MEQPCGAAQDVLNLLERVFGVHAGHNGSKQPTVNLSFREKYSSNW